MSVVQNVGSSGLSPIEQCMRCKGSEAEGSILWDCLPVPCFGNPERSKVRVITISLNPSSLEFYDRQDVVKTQTERLPMVQDFGVQDRTQLSQGHILRSREIRDHYFANNPHAWFTPMQMMLRGMKLGWSYAEGTAVQVDVVACATNPRFGDLHDRVKGKMAENCRPFLNGILTKAATGTWLVVNGGGAFNALNNAVELIPDAQYSCSLPTNNRIRVFLGEARLGEAKLPYFGWNIYLQRSPMNDAGAILDYWNALPASRTEVV